MKRLFISVAALIVSAIVAGAAAAQAFPAKPVRLVVSFPPGGATDTFSRVLAAEMTQSLGQQVIVENRPGAGTIIAAEHVVKAAPDGYTLLFTDLSTHAIKGSIYTKLNYHPLRDFAAVAAVNSSPLLLVAHPSVNVKSVGELIAVARRHPGITFGNSGIGTVTHMTAEKFRLRAGIKVTPVSYKGGALPVIALLGGEIATVMATVPASIQHVRKGSLVALGVAAERRSPFLPDIPAIAESLKGVDGAVISGVLAPAGTPREVIERLNAEIARASESAKAKEVYAANAAETLRMKPAEVQRSLERDAKEWAEVVKATGVTVN
jgi:tripartite-type tricarboxylate transporter receptor subunit TctC